VVLFQASAVAQVLYRRTCLATRLVDALANECTIGHHAAQCHGWLATGQGVGKMWLRVWEKTGRQKVRQWIISASVVQESSGFEMFGSQ
jgi:hypothetical protein